MGAARGTVAVGVHVVVPSQVARGDRSDAATRMIRPDYSPAPLSASSAVVSSGSRSEPASTMASRFSLMGFEERRSRVATRPGRPYRCPSLHASTRPFAPTADGWLSAPIYRRLATSVEDAIQDRHRLDDSEPDRLSGPTFVPAGRPSRPPVAQRACSPQESERDAPRRLSRPATDVSRSQTPHRSIVRRLLARPGS